MDKLELVRFVRDDVLRVLCQSTRTTLVRAGVECPCWRLTTDRWTAVLFNHWDMAQAHGRAIETERDRLIARDTLHLCVDDDSDPAIIFDYGYDPVDDRLVMYRQGPWEDIFERKRRTLNAIAAGPRISTPRGPAFKAQVKADWVKPQADRGSGRVLPL